MSDVATRVQRDAAVEQPAITNDSRIQGRPRDFGWFFISYAISIFGDQITLIALPIAVFARTQSALAVGVAASMQSISMLLCGLAAGALADRLRHRTVLVATDALRGALLALTALLVTTSGSYPVVVLYVAAFALGALGVLHDAASGAALPLIVSGRELLSANGRLSGAEMAGNAGGPALAGLLISLGGAALALAADALSFILSAFGVGQVQALHDAPRPERAEHGGSITADIGEGVRALWADKVVMKAVTLMAALNVVAVPVEAQFIPYAKTVLHSGPIAIGIYFAIGGVAGVVTAVLLGRARSTQGDALILGTALASAGVLLAGALPSPVTVGLTFVLVGVGSVLAMSHWASLRQRRFPVRMLGRVTMATRMVLFGVVPIAYVAGGALARSEGSESLFIVAGSIGLVTCGWAVAVGLRALHLDDVITDQ